MRKRPAPGRGLMMAEAVTVVAIVALAAGSLLGLSSGAIRSTGHTRETLMAQGLLDTCFACLRARPDLIVGSGSGAREVVDVLASAEARSMLLADQADLVAAIGLAGLRLKVRVEPVAADRPGLQRARATVSWKGTIGEGSHEDVRLLVR